MIKIKDSADIISLKLDRIFLIIILLIGILFNLSVIFANDYRMPVKTDYYLNTSSHFSFSNANEVKLYRFSDIFKIRINNNLINFSIGDIIVFSSILALLYLQIRITLKEIETKKRKKD